MSVQAKKRESAAGAWRLMSFPAHNITLTKLISTVGEVAKRALMVEKLLRSELSIGTHYDEGPLEELRALIFPQVCKHPILDGFEQAPFGDILGHTA
eukprot:5396840-Amphidinium_carterae.1